MNKKKYVIRMTPYEKLQSIVLVIVALLIFFMSMWFGGRVITAGGNSFNLISGENKPLIIVSESMTPTIKVNGIVIISEKKYEDLEVGDIILFKTDRYGLICHRIISTEGNIFTKGDHNQTVDYWTVTKDMYKGYVSEIHNEYAGIITFLFGDLNDISLARLLFGFLMLTVFVMGLLYAIIWLYQYFCVYLFLRKSSKMGGKAVVEEYYKFLENEELKEKLIDLFDSFGKKIKYRRRLQIRFELLKMHKGVIRYEKQRKKSIRYFEQFREDIEKYGI